MALLFGGEMGAMYLDICIFLAFLFCALHRVMYFSCLTSHCTVQLNSLISLTSLPSRDTTLQSHHSFITSRPQWQLQCRRCPAGLYDMMGCVMRCVMTECGG